MELKFKAKIMDEAAIDRTLIRIAHQILEKNEGTERLCLLGIRTRGVPLAQRLAANIRRIDGVDVPVGTCADPAFLSTGQALCYTPAVAERFEHGYPPDAPQPVREPASTAPASRRANLWFSFMMIYLEVSILQKRL